MKTTRHKIEPGCSVSVHIQREPETHYYSSVALCDGARLPEPVRIERQLNAVLRITGPAEICIMEDE